MSAVCLDRDPIPMLRPVKRVVFGEKEKFALEESVDRDGRVGREVDKREERALSLVNGE